MVQYIPPPDPRAIFPDSGNSPADMFAQGISQSMGNWPLAFAQMHRQAQQKQFMDSLGQSMGPRPPIQGPTGYVPPNAGPGAIPAGQRPPPAPMSLSQIAHLYQFAPGLATQIVKSQFAGMSRMQPKPQQPLETYWADPNTGRPSPTQKPGYVQVQGKPGQWRNSMQQWSFFDSREKDKAKTLEFSRRARQAKMDNEIMAKIRPLQIAKEKYAQMVEARKKLGDKPTLGALEESAYSGHGLTGHLARRALPDNVRAYLDLRTRNLDTIKGMIGGRVTQWELQTLPQGMFPSLTEPIKNVDDKAADFNHKIDMEMEAIKKQTQLQHEALGVEDESRINQMFAPPPGYNPQNQGSDTTSLSPENGAPTAEMLLDQEVPQP